QDLETQILAAIGQKQTKGGAAYAEGKTLIVFLNAGGGPWLPNKVARQLLTPLDFDDVWVVGLQRVEAGEYVYGVTRLQKWMKAPPPFGKSETERTFSPRGQFPATKQSRLGGQDHATDALAARGPAGVNVAVRRLDR